MPYVLPVSPTSIRRHRAWRRLTVLVAAVDAPALALPACDDGEVEVPERPPAEPGFDRVVAEVCGAVFRCCEQGGP